MLEPYLVRWTVAKATQADKERLKVLVKEMNEAFHGGNPMAVGRSSRKIRDEMWRVSGHRP